MADLRPARWAFDPNEADLYVINSLAYSGRAREAERRSRRRSSGRGASGPDRGRRRLPDRVGQTGRLPPALCGGRPVDRRQRCRRDRRAARRKARSGERQGTVLALRPHHAAAAADRAAHGLSEDCGRVRQPLQLLCDSGNPRRVAEPEHRVGRNRGEEPRRCRREGVARDRAGYHGFRR